VTLALRNGSSATLVLPELVSLLKTFERENSCELTLAGILTDRGEYIDLVWTAAAWSGDPSAAGSRRLALVSAGCMEKRLVTMEAVFIHLLYALDFQLAENAFNEARAQKL
jgi:hypothetical protein